MQRCHSFHEIHFLHVELGSRQSTAPAVIVVQRDKEKYEPKRMHGLKDRVGVVKQKNPKEEAQPKSSETGIGKKAHLSFSKRGEN